MKQNKIRMYYIRVYKLIKKSKNKNDRVNIVKTVKQLN